MKTSGIVTMTAGAAVAGLLIGMGIGGSGKGELADRARLQTETAASVEAMKARFDALEARLGDLGGQLGGIQERFSGTSTDLGGLSGRIDELGKSVTAAVSGVQNAVSGVNSDLSDKFTSLATRVEAMRTSAAATVPSEAPTKAASGQAIRPGETLIFGDGAAVVFLSSVDAGAGAANVAVNGHVTSQLKLEEPLTLGSCTITLTAISAPGAMIDGACGGTTAEAPAPAGLGEGIVVKMANVADLGDGAVRVFLSGVDLSEGSARVAINGTELTTLRVGAPVTVGACTVNLTGVEGTAASLSATC